jgi:dihydroorotase
MVHHAMSKIPVDEVMGGLGSGDIYTHCFHPYEDNGFGGPAGGPPRPAVLEARERGVLFDVGHGLGAFSWRVAEEACCRHGFWPDTISSDLHRFNLAGPVFDLPTTMSKFLYLGMPLEQVIRATTLNAARAMRLDDRFGRLAPGRAADIAVLQLQSGSWDLPDVVGQTRRHPRRLVPVCAFKSGQRYECEALAPQGREC